MSHWHLVSEPRADDDVEAAFEWYENERAGLGLEFLDELRTAYEQITENPFKYQDLRRGVRRVLLRRFPYAVYFAVQGDIAVILTVLRASQDPAKWQKLRE